MVFAQNYTHIIKVRRTVFVRRTHVIYIYNKRQMCVGDFIKIDRLMGIIIVLMKNERITASYLAKKFEVSRRTISRDIEDICKAGIPVVTDRKSVV